MEARPSPFRSDPVPPDLELRVEQLLARILDLEARVAALEGEPARPAEAAGAPVRGEAAAPVPAPPSAAAEISPIALLGLLGRAFLVLAGAFLIRTFTDSGALPKGIGVALGFAYAAAWGLVADRSGRRGQRQAATIHTLTVALIAFPLLWEASTRLGVLAPGWSAALLLALAAGLVAVAWRSDLEGAAWTVTLAALATGLGLLAATSAIEAFSFALLLMGAGSLWLTYGQRWHALRWPVALAADAAVAILTILAAWPGGAPAAYRGLSTGRVMALALGLVVAYLGSFAARILQRRREVSGFEVAQTILALLAGLGGAVRVVHATGTGGTALGAAVLLVGLGCYGAAFAFVEKQDTVGRNFLFFTSLALLLVFAGTPLLLDGAALTAGWIVLGLLAAMLGVRFERYLLLTHGAAYLSGAALASGLLKSSLDGFLGPQGPPQPLLGFLGGLILLGLGTGHILLSSQRSPGSGWIPRLPSLLLGVQALLVLGALAISLLLPEAGGGVPDGGTLAALRTGVLSVSAVLLALVARTFPASELGWLVYPILGATGLKLLMEDMAKGRPLTLTLAFTLFGAALLLAPRLLRKGQAESGDGKAGSS